MPVQNSLFSRVLTCVLLTCALARQRTTFTVLRHFLCVQVGYNLSVLYILYLMVILMCQYAQPPQAAPIPRWTTCVAEYAGQSYTKLCLNIAELNTCLSLS